MTITEKQQRAIARAEILGGARAAAEIQPNLYAVTGRTGSIYHVRVDGNEYRCECEAGLHGCPCWHSAAAWLHRMAENRLPAPAGTASAPVCRECHQPMDKPHASGMHARCLLYGG